MMKVFSERNSKKGHMLTITITRTRSLNTNVFTRHAGKTKDIDVYCSENTQIIRPREPKSTVELCIPSKKKWNCALRGSVGRRMHAMHQPRFDYGEQPRIQAAGRAAIFTHFCGGDWLTETCRSRCDPGQRPEHFWGKKIPGSSSTKNRVCTSLLVLNFNLFKHKKPYYIS